jgi:polyphenol oxidase
MIESENLQHPSIVHGFFTRAGGHSTGIFASLNCGLGSGDDPDLVKMNRSAVARDLGVAEGHVLTAHQVHSADVVEVTAVWNSDNRPKLDGLVTKQKGIAIATLTADCGPVMFADGEAGVIGVCHAGWKGAMLGVTDATIAAMVKLGASRERIAATLGPTISKANYEVGPEFPLPFLQQDQSYSRFFMASSKADHFMFDLPAYLRMRLKAAGLTSVHDLALCTYADESRFYSYRRATHRGEADYGRLISAIALR